MRKLHLAFLLLPALFINTNFSWSQEIDSVRLDSLVSLLTLQKKDQSTVDVYNAMTNDYLAISDYQTASKYADLAFELAEDLDYDLGALEALCNLGHINVAYVLDFQKSVFYLDQAYEIAKPLDDKNYLIRIYRGYTATYSSLGDYNKAIDFNNRALEIARSNNDDLLVSDLSAYGGNIYEELGEKKKAIEMYEEVVAIETASNFQNSSKAALVTVAHYYYLTEDAEKSLKQYRMALKKFERLKDERWVAYTHSQMAKIYLENNEVDRAERSGLGGLEIAERLGLTKEKCDNYEVLAGVYRSKQNFELSEEYQKKYDDLIAEMDVEVNSIIQLEESEVVTEVKQKTVLDRFINTGIILLLVVVVVLVSGFLGKK